ncbi:MAG: tyrosine-protein kinase [Actinomycetota bacterium]|jgi:non-specific protein-tyrosine kinase
MPAASSHEESFRVLRANLSVVVADLERSTVLITSALAGEGKTATSVNLARTLAQSGRRVVLLDLDLRHPDVHRWFGLANEVGVSDVLLDQRPLEDCLQFVDLGTPSGSARRGLYVLATGRPVPDPAEVLGTKRMSALLDALALQADVVIIDTPPVLLVADTLVVGPMVGGAVLVTEARRTPVEAVQRTKDALTRNKTRLLGVVVNKYAPRASEEMGYGYGQTTGVDGGPDGSAVRP